MDISITEGKVASFIESNYELPRFQRPLKWNSVKKFELILSVFRKFPIGAVIVSREEDEEGNSYELLLDGRQRFNCLKESFQNPELLYDWCRSFIKEYYPSTKKGEGLINGKTLVTDLNDWYWKSIRAYFELDEGKDVKEEYKQLKILINFISAIHPCTKANSGVIKLVNFKQFITLPWKNDNNNDIDREKLYSSLRSISKGLKEDSSSKDVSTLFIKECNLSAKSSKTKKEEKYIAEFEAYMSEHLEEDHGIIGIKQVLNMTKQIETRFRAAKIGLFTLSAVKPEDRETVFKLINDSGEPLTNEEILSAGRKWNLEIEKPSKDLTQACKSFYNTMDMEFSGSIVRWDVAATFRYRLSEKWSVILGKGGIESNTDFRKTLKNGFRCLSIIKTSSIKYVDYSELPTSVDDWDDITSDIEGLQHVIELINESNYFKNLSSWNISLASITSDACALYFFAYALKLWRYLGEPKSAKDKGETFLKEMFKLIDRLIYEYVTKEWRSASDSKILKLLASLDKKKAAQKVIAITQSDWEKLLKNIFKESKIGNTEVSQSLMKPIVHHYYALSQINPDKDDRTFDIDHILPQRLWKDASGSIDSWKYEQHNLYNLCLLPKKSNIKKSGKILSEIKKKEKKLVEDIENYAEIKYDDFKNHGDLAGRNKLKEFKEKKYLKIFKEKRIKFQTAVE